MVCCRRWGWCRWMQGDGQDKGEDQGEDQGEYKTEGEGVTGKFEDL